MRTAVLLVCCLVLIGCSGNDSGQRRGKPASPGADGQTRKKPPAPAPAKIVEIVAGEKLVHGELRISLGNVEAGNDAVGQHYGQFAGMSAAWAPVTVTNTSKGRIVTWSGWQGSKGTITDEHGNRFAWKSLEGWDWLPDNFPNDLPDHPPPDFGRKLHPGKTYKSYLYFEQVPKTNKRLTLDLPLEGKTYRFHVVVKHP